MLNLFRITTVATVLLVITLVTACANRPSDEELRTQITSYLLKGYRGKLYSVENFEKINGFKHNENTYTAHVQYDVVFKVDLEDATQLVTGESNDSFLKKGSDALGLLSLTAQYGNFKAGDRITQEDKLVLIKTEKGWRLKQEFLEE
ncbi:MAG: hypothetical protein LJE85_03545 [Gammaproteobacteria bacterium]|jgi:hypothetical protein|nr:hypothetical protein [Gammaproteobacteria bacterium]